MNQVYYKVHDWYFLRNVGDAGIEFLRNGLIYAYLIYLTYKGNLTLAEFVLYFGFVAIQSFRTGRVERPAFLCVV